MSALLLILLTSSVRVALVAVLVGLVLLATRARGGSVSHAAWTAVLCAMLLMPILPSVARPIAVTVPISQPAFRVLPEVEVPMALPPVDTTARTSAPSPEKGAVPLLQVKGVRPLFSMRDWAALAVAGYLLVVVLMLSRLVASAWRVSRLERRAAPLAIPGGNARLFSSSLVSVPVTTGVLRPRIILPADWASWPADKLSAVLAHERAHISRRDPLTHWLAYVNRCVFWFHPLAWWLERKLSATAEQACDAEAVRVVGDRKRYAQVLLDMAEAVRRRGGRVAWAGVGIDGAGELGQRIDQVLDGKDPGRMSHARKAAIAFGCAAAIFIVIACRQQLAATPLKEDPEVTAHYAEQKADTEFYKAAHAMNAQQAADLDAAVRRNPEDLDATRKLLIFYTGTGKKVLGWNEALAAERPHMLWLIEHHPESDLFTQFRGPTPRYDPVGYGLAKALWLAHAAAPDASAGVLSNAADFFEIADKPMAEQLLLRLYSSDPNGPMPRVQGRMYRFPWAQRLGQLYVHTILGSTSGSPVTVSVNVDEARSPYARQIRRKLDESKDPALLFGAGQLLVRSQLTQNQTKLDFDPMALGRSYLERAAQLDPSSSPPSAIGQLKSMQANDRNRRVREVLRAKEIDMIGGEIARKAKAGERLTSEEQKALRAVEYQAFSTLPESDRFAYLPWQADSSYMTGESEDYYRHDTAAAKAAWAQSERYAQDLLALAPKFKEDSHYGDAIFEGNVVLGVNALRRGDVTTAVRHMGEAARAPGLSDDFEYAAGSLQTRLVNYLLKAGERESVADFLEHTASISTRQKDQLLKDAAALRAGRMTPSYQSMLQRN